MNEQQKNGNTSHTKGNLIKRYLKNLVDFSKYDTKTIIYIILFLGLIIISLYLIYLVLFVDNAILLKITLWFVNLIYNLAFFGILLFIGVMAIQGLIIPIPSEIVLLAAGIIWGLIGGGIMGVIGSMAAAILCFYVSKKGGRPLVQKLIGENAILVADRFIHKHGMSAILIARLLPFVAFDPISYVSGLVNIEFKKYTLATFIGSIPRAFFYSFLGFIFGITPPVDLSKIPFDELQAQANFFNSILLIIVAVLVAIFILYYVFIRYQQKRIKLKDRQ